MEPIKIEPLLLSHSQILKDTGKRLYAAAKARAEEGASEESALLTKAAILMEDAAHLPFQDFMDSAESIGKGVGFGTAAIVEEQAKKFWADLITNTLKFAANIGGAILDLPAPRKAKKKSKS